MNTNSGTPSHYQPYIEQALAMRDGYLSIGRGGFILHFGDGAMLSGYDIEAVKAQCIAAGLPVIDSLNVPLEAVVNIAIAGPMVAAGREPDPEPRGALSYAPLRDVALAYAAVGAEIWNMPAIDACADRAGDPDR